MKPYRFVADAEAELESDIRYFSEQTARLGDRFAADVEAALRHICEYPESGAPFSRHIRKQVLSVFAYNLFYANEPDGIVIVAVASHKRRSGYWRKRLKEL